MLAVNKVAKNVYSCHWKVTCNIGSGHWELSIIFKKTIKNFSVTEHLLASLLTHNLQLCNRGNSHREFNIWWNISEQLFYRTNVNGCFSSENFSNSSCIFSYHLHQIPPLPERQIALNRTAFCPIYQIIPTIEKCTWKSKLLSSFMEN